jgi:isochorismate synthase
MRVVALPRREKPLARLAWALTEIGVAPAAITLPAPVAPLSIFLAGVPREQSFMWHPPTGPVAAGSGAAASITVTGSDRCEALQRWLVELFASLVHYRGEGEPSIAPRVFGGLAFEPRPARQAPWEAFGDGHFVLPRWTYVRHVDGASLMLGVHQRNTHDLDERDAILTEYEAIVDVLKRAEGSTTRTRLPAYRRIPMSCVSSMPFEGWQALVDEIKQTIASGRFTKLVAAQRCEVKLLEPLNDIDVLTRLIAEPLCTRFAFRHTDATFLGATPETLFEKKGSEVRTEALAGTIRSLGTDPPALSMQTDKLLGSDKDAIEHACVVSEIDETLGPISTRVSHPERPEIRKIRNILHLCTPFVADLNAGTTALDLLVAMHPTPAVGGLPRSGAAEWIAGHELHDRGWYTGPVGWFDAIGDGAFVVAIRSGVVTKEMAYVYTGAGIVADSDAEAEYAETQLKQLPLLRALGVDER